MLHQHYQPHREKKEVKGWLNCKKEAAGEGFICMFSSHQIKPWILIKRVVKSTSVSCIFFNVH